ncbi:CRISPR-associated helicase Cas3' [Methanobacterium sp. MBAC-LM]|uniref:CRISPR-associated helicase Cas3' n=1 Tax=Methanobacterium sp. MBAC-LM TaxID=3412034 RepID=UPI003C74C023
MDIFDLEYNSKTSTFKIGNDELLIWAHPNEPLHEHINKTMLFFSKFMNNEIIESFYNYFHRQNYLNVTYETFQELLHKMVELHDSAKISFNFQLNRLKNQNTLNILEKHDLADLINSIEINHSYVSSLLYFSYLTNKLDLKSNIMTLLCSYIIYGHHTSIKDILNQEKFVWTSNELAEGTFYLFSKYYFNKELEDVDISPYLDFQGDLYKFLHECQDPVLSFFYSYLYSLLVTSDIIASSYADKNIKSVQKYSQNWNNRINDKIINKMAQNFYKLNYNKKCKEISNEDLQSQDEINYLTDINDLRTEMLKEASFNLTKSLKSDPTKKIFYLNMPTGGGKTNTSMKLALDILENSNADRVIYAMPFINIIEQNYDIIKDNFGLSEDNGEIRKIYSASESIFSDISDDDKSEIILKDSFFDYPVLCTTFVALFNSIIKNKKKYKYTLSSLANSVIILDEIQSLPLKNWTSLYYLINEISKNYNIYFVIMSATLPNFDKLKLNKEIPFNYETVHLINEPIKYFSHYLFDRTELKNEITELNSEDEDFSFYFEDILQENFDMEYNKGLIVLNTIKMSKLVYEELYELKNEYGFEIDLLNSSIIPSEKRKIINKINNMDSDNTRYILISTQSVEAGVDVSFDFVIRDFATLDSIEQIRGRCNRSRELNERFYDENKKGNVYITNIKRNDRLDYKYIYDGEEIDTKIRETKVLLENNLNYNYKNVLDYYGLVSNNINQIQDDKETNFVFKDRDNMVSWNTLKFSELLDKNYGIHIIQKKNNQCSFFVATEMDILIDNEEFQNRQIETMSTDELSKIYENDENNFVFTLNEIKYLKRYEDKYKVQLIKNNSVNGAKLIECYDKCIKKLKKDIGAKIIIQKEFSSVLYKFIFQVTNNDFEDLTETQEFKKVGYFYVIPEQKIGDGEKCIYSMKNGFNSDFMKKENDSVEIL